MRAVREPVRRAPRDLRGGTAMASVRRRHGRRFGGDPRHDVGFGRRDRFGCCGKICASALASVGAATSAVTNRRSASTLSSLGGMAWGSSSRLLSRRRPPALGWRPVVARQARLTITIEDWPDPVPRFRSRPDFRTRLASFAPHDRGSPTADPRPRSGGTPIPGVPPSHLYRNVNASGSVPAGWTPVMGGTIKSSAKSPSPPAPSPVVGRTMAESDQEGDPRRDP